MMPDLQKIRNDFPILKQTVHGRPLIYLDNAATTQLPVQVIGSCEEHYRLYNSNVHRGAHYLAEIATDRLEKARDAVRGFLNALHPHEIIFTGGTTDSINMVAMAFGEGLVSEGDEIIVSAMEHHSNLLPWQALCKRKNARLKIIPLDGSGDIASDELEGMISERTRLVAVTHVSNVLGAVNPVERITAIARSRNVPVLIDGAQSVRHTPVDVRKMDCDFFCFSGHKIMAPAGIGVLYGKKEWLERLSPLRFGGGMAAGAGFHDMEPEGLPHRFEAGTPNCAGAVALDRALEYIMDIGRKDIAEYEGRLIRYACESLSGIEGLRVLGDPAERAGVLSFVIDGMHPYDVAVMLDKLGIAVRSGHHCARPLLGLLGLEGCVRVSTAFYNTHEEIDILRDSVIRIMKILKRQGTKNDTERSSGPFYR